MLFVVLSKPSTISLVKVLCLLVMLFVVLSKRGFFRNGYKICLLVMLFVVLSKLENLGKYQQIVC